MKGIIIITSLLQLTNTLNIMEKPPENGKIIGNFYFTPPTDKRVTYPTDQLIFIIQNWTNEIDMTIGKTNTQISQLTTEKEEAEKTIKETRIDGITKEGEHIFLTNPTTQVEGILTCKQGNAQMMNIHSTITSEETKKIVDQFRGIIPTRTIWQSQRPTKQMAIDITSKQQTPNTIYSTTMCTVYDYLEASFKNEQCNSRHPAICVLPISQTHINEITQTRTILKTINEDITTKNKQLKNLISKLPLGENGTKSTGKLTTNVRANIFEDIPKGNLETKITPVYLNEIEDLLDKLLGIVKKTKLDMIKNYLQNIMESKEGTIITHWETSKTKENKISISVYMGQEVTLSSSTIYPIKKNGTSTEMITKVLYNNETCIKDCTENNNEKCTIKITEIIPCCQNEISEEKLPCTRTTRNIPSYYTKTEAGNHIVNINKQTKITSKGCEWEPTILHENSYLIKEHTSNGKCTVFMGKFSLEINRTFTILIYKNKTTLQTIHKNIETISKNKTKQQNKPHHDNNNLTIVEYTGIAAATLIVLTLTIAGICQTITKNTPNTTTNPQNIQLQTIKPILKKRNITFEENRIQQKRLKRNRTPSTTSSSSSSS